MVKDLKFYSFLAASMALCLSPLQAQPSDDRSKSSAVQPGAWSVAYSGLGQSQGDITTLAERAFVVRAALSECSPGTNPPAVIRQNLELLMHWPEQEDLYSRAANARTKALAGVLYSSCDPAWSQELLRSAESDLKPLLDWLDDYGRMVSVHGYEEPMWIHGQPEAVAQGILAWIALEKISPDAQRRERIGRFAEGLQKLLRGDNSRYPFGAHYSYDIHNSKPVTYAVPGSDNKVAGACLIIERNYVASALAQAGAMLSNEKLIASAEREGLGLLAHLALCGQIPYDYSPRPELEVRSPLAVAAVVENLACLRQVTGKDIYVTLAGCAAIESSQFSQGAVSRAAARRIKEQLVSIGGGDWLGAKDIVAPFSGLVVELEDGKAVQKAFDTYPVEYPGGAPGKLAVVGRDNMFWMRFDVEREDHYYFHLCFMKSDVSGGLVSVMVRIDGDKIFQVNLGGASEDPFFDMDLVSGPRVLRQGPHSFGIRFSGLLMKRPAVLDSILVEPAVQRRWIALPDGRSLLVMNSIAEENVRVRMQELETAAVHKADKDNSELNEPKWTSLGGLGNSVSPQLSTDRRGRVWLDMPKGGVTILEWPHEIPSMEAVE